jgi:hypothetical protein
VFRINDRPQPGKPGLGGQFDHAPHGQVAASDEVISALADKVRALDAGDFRAARAAQKRPGVPCCSILVRSRRKGANQ